jgi:phosphoglycolate phosphatase-like HAD superfamily hydrolase
VTGRGRWWSARSRAPARALIVGDSPVDAATAQAAQVPFCGVSWGFDLEEPLATGAPVATAASTLQRMVLEVW